MKRRKFVEIIGMGAGAFAAIPFSSKAQSIRSAVSQQVAPNFPVSEWQAVVDEDGDLPEMLLI